MIARLPLIPTVLVLAAVAVMIALGFWQLDRRGEKAEMLARFEAAANDSGEVDWPASRDEALDLLYRRVQVRCATASSISSMAGLNADGTSGLAVTAQCDVGSGDPVLVVLGWSQAPVTPNWSGGDVRGVVAPGPRIVADPPLAGLEANAIPDPSEIPNNHLAYAVQWFFFAATALIIYALAVRKRLVRSSHPNGGEDPAGP